MKTKVKIAVLLFAVGISCAYLAQATCSYSESIDVSSSMCTFSDTDCVSADEYTGCDTCSPSGAYLGVGDTTWYTDFRFLIGVPQSLTCSKSVGICTGGACVDTTAAEDNCSSYSSANSSTTEWCEYAGS